MIPPITGMLSPPPIRRFLSTAGTSEFGQFQETHEFPRQRHPRVAYAWGAELAVPEVVVGFWGALCLGALY